MHCKVRCTGKIESYGNWTIYFGSVIGKNEDPASSAAPGGVVVFNVTNAVVAEGFHEGKEYYMSFAPTLEHK